MRTLTNLDRNYKGNTVSSSPLIVFWVEVSFLHCRLPLGGLTFVWQQHEGNIAVHTILTLRQQTSVHRTRKHIFNHFTR